MPISDHECIRRSRRMHGGLRPKNPLRPLRVGSFWRLLAGSAEKSTSASQGRLSGPGVACGGSRPLGWCSWRCGSPFDCRPVAGLISLPERAGRRGDHRPGARWYLGSCSGRAERPCCCPARSWRRTSLSSEDKHGRSSVKPLRSGGLLSQATR
jgi:hypothetical protein